MIPKIIHYCWFGRGEKPKLVKKCIASWKKYCPDYEIIEWNEDNFDINSNLYVRQAYENGKFAFVSDYARLYAMYTYGGIYMDTDVEVVRSLDEFLVHKAFSGFESENDIQTGIMGCEKGFTFFNTLLSYYDDKSFIDENGKMDTTTNVKTITNILSKNGFEINGKYQVANDFALYPKEYFCPLEDFTGIMTKTKNTAVIHWFNKSWVDQKTRLRSKITRPFHRIFGENCFDFIKRIFKLQ